MKKTPIVLSLLTCIGIPAAAQEMAVNPDFVDFGHYSLTYKTICEHPFPMMKIGELEYTPSEIGMESTWSVGCECLDRDYGDFSKYREYVKDLGVGYGRVLSGWAKTEKKKGKYDFGWLDEIVDGLRGEGVKPWMTLSYGNPIYGSDLELNSAIFNDDKTLDAWEKYVRETVKHFAGRIAGYEVWNEPNGGKSGAHPEYYAELLARTAPIVRELDPDAAVIGFSVYKMPLEYVKAVMDDLQGKGKADCIDYLTFHPYYQNPDDASAEIAALQKLLDGYGTGIKILQGETGCPSNLEFAHALPYREWTEYSQAKWDARRIACDFELGVPSSIFTIVDLQYPNMLQSFGLLRANALHEVIYKRPAYYAVRSLVNVLHCGLKADPDVRVAAAYTAHQLRCVGISDGGKAVGAMAWFGEKIPSSSLEKEETTFVLEGLELEDAVMVDPLTGDVFDLPRNCLRGGCFDGKMKFTDLPLWDCPVILIESGALNWTRSANGPRPR